MVECEVCGKTLGIFEGYRHPTMGKKHLLCSPCFDQVSESVARWREFVLSNSFDAANAAKVSTQLDWTQLASNFTQIRNIFDTATPEKGICIQK